MRPGKPARNPGATGSFRKKTSESITDLRVLFDVTRRYTERATVRCSTFLPAMNPTQVLDLFTLCGALLEGHFQLSSGLHSRGYLQCALVLQHPNHAATLGAAMANRVRSWTPRVVLSPALGGLIIGHEVARALGARAVFAERRDGHLMLRRGFRLDPGEEVLVIEDVITTGKSTRDTVDIARDRGAAVVGAASVINRGGPDVDVAVRFETLAEVSWPTHDPRACPLCADGIPITRPGSHPGP